MTTKTITSARGARSRARGAILEQATLLTMRQGGLLAWNIATPSTVTRQRRVWTERVAGDFFGVTPDGVAVLVECKHRTDAKGQPRRPVPSDFEAHQIDALRQVHQRGGLAMIAWFSPAHRVEMVPAVQIVGEA
jgi:hypothetical protein